MEREREVWTCFSFSIIKKKGKNAFSFPCFSFALCCSVFFFFKFEDVYIRTSRVSSSSLSKALFPSKKKKKRKAIIVFPCYCGQMSVAARLFWSRWQKKKKKGSKSWNRCLMQHSCSIPFIFFVFVFSPFFCCCYFC